MILEALADHLQQVVVHGFKANVTSGVPHGSILGPLLYIVYVDNIVTCTLLSHKGLTIFADDICYSKEVSSMKDCTEIQQDANWKCIETPQAQYLQSKIYSHQQKEEAIYTCAQARECYH